MSSAAPASARVRPKAFSIPVAASRGPVATSWETSVEVMRWFPKTLCRKPLCRKPGRGAAIGDPAGRRPASLFLLAEDVEPRRRQDRIDVLAGGDQHRNEN